MDIVAGFGRGRNILGDPPSGADLTMSGDFFCRGEDEAVFEEGGEDPVFDRPICRIASSMLRHIRRGRKGSNADVDTDAFARIRLKFSISSCIRFIRSFCLRVFSSNKRQRSCNLRLFSCTVFNIMAIEGGAIGVLFFEEEVVVVAVEGGGVDTSGEDCFCWGEDTVVFGETVRSSLCPYLSSCESGGGPSRMKGISGGGGVDTGVKGEEVPLENVISLTGEEASPLLFRGGNLEPNVGDSTLHTFGDVVVVVVNTVEILRFFDVLSNGVIVLCLDGRVGDGVFFVFLELLPLLLRFFAFLLCVL